MQLKVTVPDAEPVDHQKAVKEKKGFHSMNPVAQAHLQKQDGMCWGAVIQISGTPEVEAIRQSGVCSTMENSWTVSGPV